MTKNAKVQKKPAEKGSEQTGPDLYSLLKLEKILGPSRETIRKRLTAAKIYPHPSSSNYEKLYELNEATRAAILQASDESKQANLAKTNLQAEKLEWELAIKKGEYAPVKEFRDILVNLFGGLYKGTIQLVPNLVKKVRAAKTEAEAIEIAKTILTKPWNEARENYKRWLK